jgi:hypothetical protein
MAGLRQCGMWHESLRNGVAEDCAHGSSNTAEGLKGIWVGYGLVSYHNPKSV